MSDALDLLLPASFGGVPFHVRSDDASGGRRVVVHHAVGGELPLTEDFGGDDQQFSVDAYCAGETSGPEALGLTAILQAPGARSLILPTGSIAMARCVSWRRARSLDRIGYVGFKLEFLKVGGVAGFSLSFASLSSVVRTGLPSIAQSFVGRF